MSCTAAFNQKAYRGRNDDGSETTATWKANQNTNWSQVKDTNLRVRFEVQETAGCAKANFTTIQLQYNRNSAGWNNVTATSNVVRSSASPNLADGDATTNQLTAGTGIFVGGGGFDEVNGVAGDTAMDVSASGHFEVEYCVQIRSADVSSGDTIQLRVTDGGTAFAAYDATPSVTVSSGNVTVTPTTRSLTTSRFAPQLKTIVTPTTKSLSLSTFAPTLPKFVTPSTVAISLTTFAPQLKSTVTPTTKALTLASFAPGVIIGITVIPGTAGLSLSAFAPTLKTQVTVTTASLTVNRFAPSLSLTITPTTHSLTLASFNPQLRSTVTPSMRPLVLSSFAPALRSSVIPGTVNLLTASFPPQLKFTVIPSALPLSLSLFAPTITLGTNEIALPGGILKISRSWNLTEVQTPVISATVKADGRLYSVRPASRTAKVNPKSSLTKL